MRLTGATWRKAPIAISIFLLLHSACLYSGPLIDLDREITNLLRTVHPSVVTVHSYNKHESNSPRSFMTKGSEPIDTLIGTGVVYDDRGHIITTRYVVSGGSRFEAITRDGKRYEAVLVGVDPEIDLAVLQIAAGQLPPLPVANSAPVYAGSVLLVVGNSFGIPNAALLATAIGYREDGSLQVSANLAPGFSGGPVVNVRGEMVGMVSAKLTEPVNLGPLSLSRRTPDGTKEWGFSGGYAELPSTGVVLAVGSSDISSGADRLISGDQRGRGFLGVQPQDVNAEWLLTAFNVKHGVMVSNVLSNSPAWDAGIRTGDILTQFLGRRVTNAEQLRSLIASHRPGDLVSLVVVRSGRNLSFTVQLSSKDAMRLAGVLDSETNNSDSAQWQTDTKFPVDEDDRSRIERRIIQLRRDMLRQLDELNALQRELERLGKGN